MALILTIASIVLLIMVRLFIPPVPALLKTAIDRWGKRSTIMLCATALVGAVLLILVSRRWGKPFCQAEFGISHDSGTALGAAAALRLAHLFLVHAEVVRDLVPHRFLHQLFQVRRVCAPCVHAAPGRW